MVRAWLLKRLVYLAGLIAVPTCLALALALVRDWSRVAALLNGSWPPWVSSVANVVQIGSPAIALLIWWMTRASRSRRTSTEPGASVAARLLRLLALLLPARDRERFIGEVVANMADPSGGGSASTSCCRWRPRCRAWP